MTKTLVPELGLYNIRINCIVPGLFRSDLTSELLNSRGEEISRNIPLKFIGEVSDFDAIMLYFVSNAAPRFVTSASITIDGGASWSG